MQLQRVFLPQSTATFAAIETFNALRRKYPEYNYRLPATGKDQVATLARAFNRMRRSLEKAMKMDDRRVIRLPSTGCLPAGGWLGRRLTLQHHWRVASLLAGSNSP